MDPVASRGPIEGIPLHEDCGRVRRFPRLATSFTFTFFGDIEMMTGTTEIDHKKTLYSMVEAACEYESKGNAVLRDQMLRSIENVPLPPELVCAVLDNVGLLRTYQGARP
jgi:hypothetical protein